MTNTPNIRSSFEWLYPILKADLQTLHSQLSHVQSTNDLIGVSQGYKEIADKLESIALVDFAYWARLLHVYCQSLSAIKQLPLSRQDLMMSLSQDVVTASQLLLQELTHFYEIGTYQQALLNQQIEQLHAVLNQQDILSPLKLKNEQVADESIQHSEPIASEDDDGVFIMAPKATSKSVNKQKNDSKNTLKASDDNRDKTVSNEAKTSPNEANTVIETEPQTATYQETTSSTDTVEIQPIQQTLQYQMRQRLQPYLDNLELPSDNSSVDEEIKEIFVEEAQEILEDIAKHFRQWQANPDSMEDITDIRRGFHTLKGSGRMAGANHSAELAWAVENMLNRVLDCQIKLTPGMMSLVGDVIEGYPNLMTVFEESGEYPETLQIWIASAQLYSQLGNQGTGGRSDSHTGSAQVYAQDFDYQLMMTSEPQYLSGTTDLLDKKADAHQYEQLPQHERQSPQQQSLPDGQEATKVPTTDSTRSRQVIHGSYELTQIFIEESENILSHIEQILVDIKLDMPAESTHSVECSEDALLRAFHTLQGAASSQSHQLIADICAAVQKGIKQRQNYSAKYTSIPPKQYQAVAQSVDFIRHYIDFLKSDAAIQTVLNTDTEDTNTDNIDADHQELLVSHLTTTAYLDIPDRQRQLTQLYHMLEQGTNDGQQAKSTVRIADLIAHIDDLLEAQWQLNAEFNQDDVSIKDSIKDYTQRLHTQSDLLLSRVQSSGLPQSKALSGLVEQLSTLYKHVTDAPLLITENLSKVSKFGDGWTQILVDAHNQITEWFDALAAGMVPKFSESVIHQLGDLTTYIASIEVDTESSVTKSSSQTQVLPASDYDGHNQDHSFFEEITTDPELLGIFIEEAQELDAQIVDSLSQWAKDPSNKEPVTRLQRYLHTLKGGARMAGIKSIADLTHATEALYDNFVADKAEPNATWVQAMQKVQDTLSDQIDSLNTNGQSFFADKLVSQLQALEKNKYIPDGYRLQLPQQRVDYQKSSIQKEQSDITPTQLDVDESVNTALSIKSVSEQQQIAHSNIHDLNLTENSQDQGSALKAESMPEPVEQESLEREFDRMRLESWQGVLPDPDILNVFVEEAWELVDLIDDHLQALDDYSQSSSNAVINSNPSKPIEVTLNTLHDTLQRFEGGAHMVYAQATAEVAASMAGVCSQGLAALTSHIEAQVIKLLQVCQQWLKQAVYLLQHGVNPPLADTLLVKLNQAQTAPDKLGAPPDVSLQSYIDAIDRYEAWRDARLGLRDISEMPSDKGVQAESEHKTAQSNEVIRVPERVMSQAINLSGESIISRSRIELSINSLGKMIDEMGSTVHRLADQLRRMDVELETQVLAQFSDEHLAASPGFDPLEMDQYSAFNQLSKSLSESASDLLDIKSSLQIKTQDAETLLLQLSRTQSELQGELMASRRVPFSRIVPRLQRIVRQTANELDKSVDLVLINEDNTLDRTLLDRLTGPIEHMLRNAIAHGIETNDERQKIGKPSTGQIKIEIIQEGNEVVIGLLDDGRGIDVESVRQKAVSRGLIAEDDNSLTDLEIMQFIFNAGLTTSNKITQISGRGVGMDVVLNEVRQLGGSVSVVSKANQGAQFLLRLPLTVAVTDVLTVRASQQDFVIPLTQIERIERVNANALSTYYQSDSTTFTIGDSPYRLRYLNEVLLGEPPEAQALANQNSKPVIIIKNQAGQKLALQVDAIIGSRMEAVIKPLGKPLTNVKGISAATITAEGSVMLILDALALLRHAPVRQENTGVNPQAKTDANYLKAGHQTKSRRLPRQKPSILIVDDSVTVRKVTSRLLERHGYETQVARDGLEAMEQLQQSPPDLMLLDIEMPRMDGFEVATRVRHDSQLAQLPIIMITSRTGSKHHKRALDIGVNAYMGKPFQEEQLLQVIQSLLQPQNSL